MQSTPEPEPEPAPVPQAVPVAQMQPANEPTVISSGEEPSSDEEVEDAPGVTTAFPLEVDGQEDEDIWATVNEVVGDFAAAEEEQEEEDDEEVSQAPHSAEQDSGSEEDNDVQSQGVRSVEVIIPRDELEAEDLADIIDYTAGGDVVHRVLDEGENSDGMMEYTVEFEDYHVDKVRFACDFTSREDGNYIFLQSCRLHHHPDLNTLTILQVPFAALILYRNGQKALNNIESKASPDPITEATAKTGTRRSSGRMSPTRPRARASRQDGFVDTTGAVELSDPEPASEDELSGTRRSNRNRQQDYTPTPELPETDDDDDDEDGDSVQAPAQGISRRGRPKKNAAPSRKSLRHSNREPALDDSDRDILAASSSEEDEDTDGAFLLKSDVVANRKRTRRSRDSDADSRRIKRQREGERQSGRANKHNISMKEVDIDNIYRSDSSTVVKPPPKPKVTAAKEVFKQLPRNDEFRMRHSQQCEVCNNGVNFAPLIYCQGCTFAYHKLCIGPRGSRDHLVTKVGEEDYVLQCRRCIALVRKKEPTAPDQGKCQDCTHHGAGCRAFRPRKTTAQEQREREENDGV